MNKIDNNGRPIVMIPGNFNFQILDYFVLIDEEEKKGEYFDPKSGAMGKKIDTEPMVVGSDILG